MANIFRTASTWMKVAAISFALGLVLFVIGFATTAWSIYPYSKDGHSNGLWQYYVCFTSCSAYTYSHVNDYHRAIQAMECLGLIGYILAIVAVVLYLAADSFRRRDFLQAATTFAFIGITFACIGFALFGSRSNTDNRLGYYGQIGWSMGIAIAGTILYGIGGIMLIIQLIR